MTAILTISGLQDICNDKIDSFVVLEDRSILLVEDLGIIILKE